MAAKEVKFAVEARDAPGIDVMSNCTVARAEIPMVTDERDETGLSEVAGEALEPMFLDPRITMGDGDGR